MGNCFEFSIIAFMYLFDRGVRPIDLMALVGADHTFVVIGRHRGDPNAFDAWGPDAVICDPWGRGFRRDDKHTGTYPATRFREQMTSLLPFTAVRLRHREQWG